MPSGGAMNERDESSERAPSGTSRGKARILLAEDNLFNQQVALGALDRSRYIVDTVVDGNEVLSALQRVQYDLILMDCMMPGLDGYQATRTIRSSQTLGAMSAIPIIALTANGSKEARQRCSEAGMNDFVAKPIDFEVLVATVEKWLALPAPERM